MRELEHLVARIVAISDVRGVIPWSDGNPSTAEAKVEQACVGISPNVIAMVECRANVCITLGDGLVLPSLDKYVHSTRLSKYLVLARKNAKLSPTVMVIEDNSEMPSPSGISRSTDTKTYKNILNRLKPQNPDPLLARKMRRQLHKTGQCPMSY